MLVRAERIITLSEKRSRRRRKEEARCSRRRECSSSRDIGGYWKGATEEREECTSVLIQVGFRVRVRIGVEVDPVQ